MKGLIIALGPAPYLVIVMGAAGIFTLAAGVHSDAVFQMAEIHHHAPGGAACHFASVIPWTQREFITGKRKSATIE